ncbi:MAG: tyrosine-type recombinase/integrase [Gaiellaceae bacterium]
MSAKLTGIRRRHGRGCDGAGRCECSWEASVYSRIDGRKIRRTFATRDEAKAWRSEAETAVRKGKLRPASRVTLREAAAAWLEGAKSGAIRTRAGGAYKPSAIRGYTTALYAEHELPGGRRFGLLYDFGGSRLADIRRGDLQGLVETMQAAGFDASTIRNYLMPVRAIFRRAIRAGDISVNPTADLDLPAVRGRRDRIAPPEEAAKLLAALRADDRVVWATALYAGLRRGELLALTWDDVDLAAGRVRVERSWDPGGKDQEAGVIEPKSRAGNRTVPIPAVLRDYLLEWKHRSGRSEGLVFGRTGDVPFEARTFARRAESAWKKAELEPISLHECRHTFASILIAAGVNAKALSTYVGHSSIQITYDRYGHLMPGSEDEAAELADAYLARADTAARLAQVAPDRREPLQIEGLPGVLDSGERS